MFHVRQSMLWFGDECLYVKVPSERPNAMQIRSARARIMYDESEHRDELGSLTHAIAIIFAAQGSVRVEGNWDKRHLCFSEDHVKESYTNDIFDTSCLIIEGVSSEDLLLPKIPMETLIEASGCFICMGRRTANV